MYENVKMPEGMNPEVLEHLMNPKNYGKLDDANGIGVALDEKTKEYVIFYIHLEGETLKNVSFATNGCQDTVVIGSMFSEMIKNNDIEYAKKAIEKMHAKLGEMTPQQKICAELVFTAFIAALKNHDNLQEGKEEELHLLKMKDSCEATNMQEGTSNE
jgi:nitrogen fixation NifU-like protein